MFEFFFFVGRDETWMKRSHFSEKFIYRFVNDEKNNIFFKLKNEGAFF